jgi:hypothetical protein
MRQEAYFFQVRKIIPIVFGIYAWLDRYDVSRDIKIPAKILFELDLVPMKSKQGRLLGPCTDIVVVIRMID